MIAKAKRPIKPSHQHLPFYQRNLQHMHSVLEGFGRSAAPAQNAARKIANLLDKNRMPVKKYFGTDAAFIKLFTWLGLQGVLKNRFTVK